MAAIAPVAPEPLRERANLVLTSIEYHAAMMRVLTAISGLLLLVLAIPYGAGALLIGSGSIPIAALLGLYAVALAAVGVGLLLPGRVENWLWPLSIGLPVAPLILTLFLRLIMPPPDTTGAPDSGPWIWLLPLIASACSLAAFLLMRKSADNSAAARG